MRSADDLLRVAQDRLRIGNGNEQSVAEARASAGTYRDRLREIEQAREQALRALELLVGRYPGAEIAVADRLSPMPPPAPVGMPSELLERRPDVIAAERRVAAAFDRVGEARAAMLPRISLTAGGSSVSSELIVLKSTRQPHLELRRQPDRTAVSGRRAARAGRDPVGGAEAGGRGVRARGPAGVRRSRERARRRERAARSLRHSRGHDPRQRTRARALANPVSRRDRRSARGRAEPAGAVFGPHRAPARADGTARAAGQPVPGAGGRVRPAPAGDGTGGRAVMQRPR